MLKPHDIFILLFLTRYHSEDWTYAQLSDATGIAQSELHRSLERATHSHLFSKTLKRVRSKELLEFLTHGIRYAFAITPTDVKRGMPTMWRAPGLEDYLIDDPLAHYVWPHPRGTHRGKAIEPLHHAVIYTIAEHDDTTLHRWLAICDILRIGSARERDIATKIITEELKTNVTSSL